jgi:hypothetical protein
MRNETPGVERRDREEGTPAGVPWGIPPTPRPSSEPREPILVELAWLVIEGAVLLRRLRGLLARI